MSGALALVLSNSENSTHFDIRGQLFKTNVVSSRFVKILKYYKYADIFCWKNVRIFCIANYFQQKITVYLII